MSVFQFSTEVGGLYISRNYFVLLIVKGLVKDLQSRMSK